MHLGRRQDSPWCPCSERFGFCNGYQEQDVSDPGKVRLKDRIEYAALLAVANCLQALPVETAAAFCGFCWRHIAPRTRRQKRVLAHLRLAFPHLTDDEVKNLSLRVWDNLGRVMAETLHLRTLRARALESPYDHSRIGPVREQVDHGLVVASGHIGAYELIVVAALQVGAKPAGIYQELKNPLVDRYLADLRRPMFPAGLFSKSHKAARQVLSLVKAGGTAAFLADQREIKGVKIRFFGQPAYANPFPAMLARHCTVPFMAGRIIRRLDGSYMIDADEVAVPADGSPSEALLAATQNFHDVLETYIREYPEQWMWTHRKWALPEGETEAA